MAILSDIWLTCLNDRVFKNPGLRGIKILNPCTERANYGLRAAVSALVSVVLNLMKHLFAQVAGAAAQTMSELRAQLEEASSKASGQTLRVKASVPTATEAECSMCVA